MLRTLVDSTKLDEVANTQNSRIRIQNDLKRLEKWSTISQMRFSKNKGKAFQLGLNNDMHTYRLMNDWVGFGAFRKGPRGYSKLEAEYELTVYSCCQKSQQHTKLS